MTAIAEAPVRDLRQHPDNPRSIESAELERLCRSLNADRGMLDVRPLVALPDGTVIMGNHRLLAARELGWVTIPTVYVDLDENRAREWAVKDNNGWADWDRDPLARLLRDMEAAGTALDELGFKDDELADLLAELDAEPETAGDTEAPAPPADPVTQPGDVIRLGDHVLVCGDARDFGVYDVETADMVLTDPPYGVDYTGSSPDGPRGGKTRERLAGDHTPDAYREALPALLAYTTPTAPILLWVADRHLGDVLDVAHEIGLEHRATIVWVKTGGGVAAWAAQYMPYHEPLLYLHRRGQAPGWYGPSNERTVWEHPQAASNEHHPTQKPVELYERAIANHTRRGDLVLDPFAGSGTLAIACENTGRRARMIELDPGYCDVIVNRWEQHTGQQAVR